ncbi:MAG: ABC transporter substrate-binding protein [Bacteroidaceae bacterium]|nr:ABC transporter substrate-binding protein [Bacteroidaceae bacterium]
MRVFIAFFIVICTILQSCGRVAPVANVAVVGDTLPMRHSSLLQMVECGGYTVVNVKNPWKENTYLHRYILSHKDSVAPLVPQGFTLLRTPVSNQLIFATLHAQLFVTLGCEEAISGVCDARYMSVPQVSEALHSGKIVDCGSSVDVNLERLMELSPEAAWVIPFKNGGYGKMERVDIPLIECVDYMENSPLGGAEWVRFYGRLLGVADKADSLFFAVCDNYERVKKAVASCATRPRMMCELKTGSAWYMPGGGSTMGQLYRDAGANYLFGDDNSSGSVPFSFETVLSRADSADVWLIKYGADRDKSYSSLEQEFAGYALLRPFREKSIFACNVSNKRFYEETPFRPDILLEELACLLHPELNDDYKFRYYEKLQE